MKHLSRNLGLLIGIILSISCAQASQLTWQVVSGGKPFMDVAVDDKGYIEGSFYKDGKPIQTKYFYVGEDYTCSSNLKEDFQVTCQNMCFPSYRQKGLNFLLNLPREEMKQCKSEKVKGGFLGFFKKPRYLGFKSEVHKITCPSGSITVTLIPQFNKEAQMITQSGNPYFKELEDRFKIKGFFAKIVIQDNKTKKDLDLYEVKELLLHKNKGSISLPQDYLKVSTQDFFPKMDNLKKKVDEFNGQKRKTLEKNSAKNEISKIQTECKKRFPAQTDLATILNLCSQDPKMKERMGNAMQKWQSLLQKELFAPSQEKFQSGIKQILEGLCKK